MPIPFRHTNEGEELGAAAYLKIEAHSASLFINGEAIVGWVGFP